MVKPFTDHLSRFYNHKLPSYNSLCPMWTENSLDWVQNNAGLNSENKQLPSHNLCLGQSVMYQDSVTKRWYSATITSLCQEPRSYKVTTKDSVIYI